MAAMGRLGAAPALVWTITKYPWPLLHVFMKLNTSNGIPVLPEYAFALCEPGSWPFQSTMDINILLEACLAYDTPAESENQLEEPASAVPETNSGTSKKRKHRGKGKGRSKSAGTTSSASEASPGRKNQTLPALRCNPGIPGGSGPAAFI